MKKKLSNKHYSRHRKVTEENGHQKTSGKGYKTSQPQCHTCDNWHACIAWIMDDGYKMMGIPLPGKCISPRHDRNHWHLTLKNLFSNVHYVMNICAKFHGNPFTKCRDIASRKKVLMDGQ